MVYLLNGMKNININIKSKKNEKVLFEEWRRGSSW